MATVNELSITNFVDTGLTTPMARYTFTFSMVWTDDAGVQRTIAPVTKTFPNDLAAMPLAVRKRFAIQMIDATARVAAGIANWQDFE